MARLIIARVNQTVLGYEPRDLVEVDADDPLVDAHLTGKQVTKLRDVIVGDDGADEQVPGIPESDLDAALGQALAAAKKG